jgi:hypothetical protein
MKHCKELEVSEGYGGKNEFLKLETSALNENRRPCSEAYPSITFYNALLILALIKSCRI